MQFPVTQIGKESGESFHTQISAKISMHSTLSVSCRLMASQRYWLEFSVQCQNTETWVEIYNPSNYSITARLAQQMKEDPHAEAYRPFRLTKSLSGAGNAKVRQPSLLDTSYVYSVHPHRERCLCAPKPSL